VPVQPQPGYAARSIGAIHPYLARWLRKVRTARTRRWSSSLAPSPNLARMLATWVSMVRSVSQRRRAMPTFVRPSAMSVRTSRSRGVSVAIGLRRGSADPPGPSKERSPPEPPRPPVPPRSGPQHQGCQPDIAADQGRHPEAAPLAARCAMPATAGPVSRLEHATPHRAAPSKATAGRRARVRDERVDERVKVQDVTGASVCSHPVILAHRPVRSRPGIQSGNVSRPGSPDPLSGKCGNPPPGRGDGDDQWN